MTLYKLRSECVTPRCWWQPQPRSLIHCGQSRVTVSPATLSLRIIYNLYRIVTEIQWNTRHKMASLAFRYTKCNFSQDSSQQRTRGAYDAPQDPASRLYLSCIPNPADTFSVSLSMQHGGSAPNMPFLSPVFSDSTVHNSSRKQNVKAPKQKKQKNKQNNNKLSLPTTWQQH